MTPKQLTKTKWDYIKLKKASTAKRNDQQNGKATSGMGENICQTHKGLSIQNLHTLTVKKPNNLIFKWAEIRTFFHSECTNLHFH